MKRLIVSLLMAVLAAPAFAQLTAPPRTIVAVVDPANVINDRGSKLEVYPTQRATPLLDARHRNVVHQVTIASANSPIGAQQLGVVFNHAMQQHGFITGEIAFRSMSGVRPSDMTASSYPGLKRITASGVYVVKAGTPTEFISLMKRLQARTDLEWVEPTITYGSLKTNATIQ
jgi:hypothetical protein